MRSSTDLEDLIRRLAGRGVPNDRPGSVDREGRPQPDRAPSADEVDFFDEIRRRTRFLFDDPGAAAASSDPLPADDPARPLHSPAGPSGRRARPTPRGAFLGGAALLLFCGLNALGWWLADRSVAAHQRDQTALLIAELRRVNADQARGGVPAPAAGPTLDALVEAAERRLKADLAEIDAKLTALAQSGSGPPSRGGPADQDSRPSKRAGGAPSASGPDPAASVPSLGDDLAAIRREVSSSEAATARQLQEMRTVLHELNAVVRRVLSRPATPDSSTVTLPLLAVAVQALINNLQHQTTQVRGEAVEQLIRLGPLARSALPALRQMQSRESDPNVRSAVEAAISVISSN